MRDLTLAERLLARIAEISRRSDVVVHDDTGSWGGRVGRWADTLPAEMSAFYERLNGYVFHYSFTDAPDHWHGFALLALDSDGKKVIDPKSRSYRLPRRVASRYPEHFFQPDAVDPDAEVLFFLGDDSAWGVLMVGAGEGATFLRWDNDGFVQRMPGTFTDLVERLLANGFAHTWACDSHPDSDAVRARLATPVPERITFELEVSAKEELAEDEARRALLAKLGEPALETVTRALGLTKRCATLSLEEQLAVVSAACAEPLPEKTAIAVMRATGHKKPTRELFEERFLVGAGTLARLSLRLRYARGVKPVILEEATLVRVLDSLPGVDVAATFPGPRALLQCAYPPKCSIWWTPFAESSSKAENKKYTDLSYVVLLPASRVTGLEAGRTYTSSALPTVG